MLPLISLAQVVEVGSKRFTESYVLGEIAVGELREQAIEARHRQGMGGTIVLWEALRSGGIDAYPEYTGTIAEQILKQPELSSVDALEEALAEFGVGMSGELGFNNTYALVMRREQAEELGIERISDLRQHPDLVYGFTHEFLDRSDGWQPLKRAYDLDPERVHGIDHALAYAALAAGSVDVVDAYSTDAKVVEEDLRVLEDDLSFFPEYKAVFLYRKDLSPEAVEVLEGFAGAISQSRMVELNAVAERANDFRAAARAYLNQEEPLAPKRALAGRLGRLLLQHIWLVAISMGAAVVVGLPLGIAASRRGVWSQIILGVVGICQTIPALALLALLVPVPFLGISPRTAIVALFLYSLLPIVRNTASGLQDIAPDLRESARALGMKASARLSKIYLPLASRSILAGIKTSAVINVGTATLAALIGGGGLGEPIISGLSLNHHPTILLGAIPAALLALTVQLLFELLDRWLIPAGLR